MKKRTIITIIITFIVLVLVIFFIFNSEKGYTSLSGPFLSKTMTFKCFGILIKDRCDNDGQVGCFPSDQCIGFKFNKKCQGIRDDVLDEFEHLRELIKNNTDEAVISEEFQRIRSDMYIEIDCN